MTLEEIHARHWAERNLRPTEAAWHSERFLYPPFISGRAEDCGLCDSVFRLPAAQQAAWLAERVTFFHPLRPEDAE